jgi:hypothetical protein
MRKLIAFSITIIGSLLQFEPSIAANNCAIGVTAIVACQLPAPNTKSERRDHPRHRAEKLR